MSLPTKQEVVSKAHTLGFSERIKFGAKLGHAQASNAELSTLLKSVRDYEPVAAPQLDAASVQVSSFLPTQQLYGAKHFDVEQVALAVATAAQKREVLETEVRGPNAANLTYACDRLVGMTKKDTAGVAYLFDLLVSLPEKRKKPLIKALLKHQHQATLERYVKHIASSKDLLKQLTPFIHGCSRATIVKYLPQMFEHGSHVNILHLCRYRAEALLDCLETRLTVNCSADEPGQFANEWQVWYNRLSNGLGVFLQQKPVAARLLALAHKYPSSIKHWEVWYPTVPQIVLTHWKTFTKFHYDALMNFVYTCIRPESGMHYFTFSFGQNVTKRKQVFDLLEKTIPRSIDSGIPEYSQTTLPEIFTRACNLMSELKYMPDVLEYCKKLIAWAQRYAAKFPVLSKQKEKIWLPIFANAASALNGFTTRKLAKIDKKKNEALEKIRHEGKSPSALTGAMLGKQIDQTHITQASIELYKIFVPLIRKELDFVHKKDAKDIDYTTRVKRDSCISIFDRLFTESRCFETHQLLHAILPAYKWVNDSTTASWNHFDRKLFGMYKSIASEGFKTLTHRHVDLHNTPAQVAKFKEQGKAALALCLKMVSNEPNVWMSSIQEILGLIGEAGWEPLAPFFNLLKFEHFKEQVKEGHEDVVIGILTNVPINERQPILNALFEPKVCTPGQRQKLQQLLSISDAKTRKTLEQATSSSSPGERAAAIIRLVISTKALPCTREGRNFNDFLNNPQQCAEMIKESSTTLAFVIKRIKNATFQDRVIIQNLAFKQEDFSTVWLTPGVGPAQFALWTEMLDDHLQNPQMVLGTVSIEEPEQYNSALSDYGFTTYGSQRALTMWESMIWSAIVLGITRKDDALLEFGFQVAAKIGTAETGAGDPLGTRINYHKIGCFLVTVRDPARSTVIIEKLLSLVKLYCLEEELKPIKVRGVMRALVNAVPPTHLRFLPLLEKFVRDQYEAELAALKPVAITDILKPPTLPTGFEDEAELDEIAMKQVLPTLINKAKKKTWMVPVLVDYVFNVALKSWAAAGYLPIAFRIRQQSAFHAHRVAFKGTDAEYRKPQGAALRKFEMDICEKFAREMLAISPSVLNNTRIQRTFAKIDPSILFSHITTDSKNLDDIADETEKLHAMEKVGLLGPFTGANANSTVSVAVEVPRVVASRGRAVRGRGGRGGRVVRRPRPIRSVGNRASAGNDLSVPTSTVSAVASTLAQVRDITKKWRRGQSTKSSDNTAYFMPTLCYGMTNWHAAQILSLGQGIASALMNPMRSLAEQKRLAILWSLLPTTTYGDIVIFLQQNDYNFFPEDPNTIAQPEEEPADDEETPKAKKPSAAPAAAATEERKAQLPLAVVEAMIRGVTMNDEPLAPLAFLLSPTFLSSNYSRTAIAAVQALMAYVPGGLLTNALAYLLKEHRATLKTTAHKQIIRFLSEHVCVEHWDIFLSEWKHPKTHRDVRITLLQTAFNTLSISTGEVAERVWNLLELAVQHREADVVCALLKTQPSPLPKRLPPFDLPATVLLNNRVKNQYNSYTTVPIPADCSARYMSSIITPLLQRGAPISGMDIQFLAYYTLRYWAGFLNTTTPGQVDVAEFGEVLVSYLIGSLESGALWESGKKKELEAAVQRWSWVASTLTWLLTLHPNCQKREDIRANASLTSDDYEMEGKAEIIARVMSFLTARLDSFEQPKLTTPEEEMRFRAYSNTINAITHFVSLLDDACVRKGNATSEEQELWLKPLRESSAASLFDDHFMAVQIHALPTNSFDPGFLDLYKQFIEKVGENHRLRSNAYNLLSSWLTSHKTYAAETNIIKGILKGAKERIRAWNTPAKRTLDLQWTWQLAQLALGTWSPYTLSHVAEEWIDICEYLLLVASDMEKLSALGGFGRALPSLVNQITSSFSCLLNEGYDSTVPTRKKFVNWIIDRALENIKKYHAGMQSISVPQADYVNQWRSLLAYFNGNNLARYAPTRVGEVLDAVAYKEPIADRVTAALAAWMSPSSNIVDPSLAGVGHPGVDHAYASKLMKDLVECNLASAPVDPKYPRNETYHWNVLNALSSAMASSVNSTTLLAHYPKTWWQAINVLYAHSFQSLVSSSGGWSISHHVSSCQTLPSNANRSEYTEAELTTIRDCLKRLEELHNGHGIKLGVPAVWNDILEFDLVKADLAEVCKSEAITLASQIGESTALVPPKGTGSTLAVWLPEVRHFLTKLTSATSSRHRLHFATSALEYRMHPVPVEQPAAATTAKPSDAASSSQ